MEIKICKDHFFTNITNSQIYHTEKARNRYSRINAEIFLKMASSKVLSFAFLLYQDHRNNRSKQQEQQNVLIAECIYLVTVGSSYLIMDDNFPASFIPQGFGESGNDNLPFLGD